MTDQPAVISADDVEERQPPTDAQLKNVRDYAATLWKKRKELARLLDDAQLISTEIEVLEMKTIPDAMRAIGMDSFSLTGGFRIDLEKFAHGSVKKEDEPKLHAWLEKVGWESIIKHTITIAFGKGEDKWAKKFLADLAKRKKPIQFERKDAIHASTWKSFFKERFAEDAAGKTPPEKRLPREIINVHEGERAVLVDPAEDAAKAEKKAASKKPKDAKIENTSEVEL